MAPTNIRRLATRVHSMLWELRTLLLLTVAQVPLGFSCQRFRSFQLYGEEFDGNSLRVSTSLNLRHLSLDGWGAKPLRSRTTITHMAIGFFT